MANSSKPVKPATPPPPNKSKTLGSQEHHDTWAVFLAAIQVIGPVVLLMVGVVLGAYGILHLLFLR